MAEITAKLVQELREQTGLGMMQCKKALNETGGNLQEAVDLLRKQGAAVAAKRAGREAKEGKVLLGQNDSVAVAVEINCETDFVATSGDFGTFGDTILKAVLTQQPKDLDALKALEVDGSKVSQLNTDIIAKIGENISVRRFVAEPVAPNEMAETYAHMGGKIGVIVKLALEGTPKNKEALSALAKDLCMQVAAMSPVAVDKSSVDAAVVAKEREIYREQTLGEGKPEAVVDKIVDGRLNKFFKESCLVHQVFVKDSKQTVEQLLAAAAKEQGLSSLNVVSFHRMQLGQ